MTRARPDRSHALAPTLALVLALVAGRPAAGQGPIPVEDDTAAEAQAQAQAVAVGRLAINQGFLLSEQNFNQWTFGVLGNEEAARRKLDLLLAVRVDEVARACDLSESQRRRLELAGRVDIARLFDRVDDARRVFEALKADRNRMNEVFQAAQPLQQGMNLGLFGEGSFLAKAVRSSLDDAQAGRLAGAERDRLAARHRARVGLAVAMIDQSAGLTDAQRARLVDLALAETRPLPRPSPYDYHGVLYQVAKIPEAKLRAILTDAQWRAIGRQRDQALALETVLRNNGALLDPPPANAGATGGAR